MPPATLRAEPLDRFHVDGAAEAGLEPARPARVIDARPFLRRRQAAGDGLDGLFRIARRGLAGIAASGQCADGAVGARDAVEASIEQRIRNAGLLLHAVGERDVGVVDDADVEDQVGLERQHHFEIGGIAAAGDAPDLR